MKWNDEEDLADRHRRPSRLDCDGWRPCTRLTTPEQLLSHIPGITDICGVDCLQLLNLDSTNMTPAHWLEIAACIREHYGCYDGFVITHGTDTMAYTAAALSYLIQGSPKPIVLTGAQRPSDGFHLIPRQIWRTPSAARRRTCRGSLSCSTAG